MTADENKERSCLVEDTKKQQNGPQNLGAAEVEMNVEQTECTEIFHSEFIGDALVFAPKPQKLSLSLI